MTFVIRDASFLHSLLFAGITLAGLSPAIADEPQPPKPGDRVVFLGDSITQAGDRPGGYVALVREAVEAKYGEGRVEVVGAGISGNKVPDLQRRLQRDVLDREPTLVVIYIGINDVWHSLRDQGTPKDRYEAGLREIVGRIGDAGARVVLATPSVIGEKHDGSNRLDAMLDEYAAVGRRVAEDAGAQILDLRKAFQTHLKGRNPMNKEQGALTTDGVHLNADGNRFVADRMLEALGVAEKKSGLLRHVVLFKFKPEVTDEQIREVVEAFAALPGRIDEIVGFEWGTDVSVEGKAKGFTHGFVVTFRDEAGRDAYLPHPAHDEFVKLVGPRLDDVLVFDYWARTDAGKPADDEKFQGVIDELDRIWRERSAIEWFDMDLPWGRRDAMEITVFRRPR